MVLYTNGEESISMLSSNNWRRYNYGVFPNIAPDLEISESTEEIKSLINIRKRNFYVRWTTNFDCENETSFWYIIKDNFDGFNELSANTRSKVRRGLKKCMVRKITLEELKESGYSVYQSAYLGYSKSSSYLDEGKFKEGVNNLSSDYELWGVFFQETNKLVAYSQNRLYSKSCEYRVIKLNPDYLKYYTSYALIFKMNEHYLLEKKLKYVNDDARNISHQTNIQDFLEQKFKFRKAYCKLHVEYVFALKIILLFLTFTRPILNFLPAKYSAIINTLLVQEEIRSSFE